MPSPRLSQTPAPPVVTLEAGLYVVATPIGHLGDITLRALETLGAVDSIACEDTRTTAKLLSHYGIHTPRVPYHEHNARAMRPQLIARLQEGARIALVSDAGTPLISDPGYKLVQEAAAVGIKVTPVPGASSVLAALSVAGLPTDQFHFAGFLPTKAGARAESIQALAVIPATLVLFESARRLPASLAALARWVPERDAVMARELTKLYEELRRGSIAELAAHYQEAGAPRGEVVLLIGPPPAQKAGLSDDALDRLLQQALATHSVKDAAKLVAATTGTARQAVYQRALLLQGRR